LPEAGVEERLARLEARARRARLFSLVKYSVYTLIIVGVIVYGVELYRTAGEWRVELADTPRVGLESPRVLSVSVPVRIFNPDGDVMARLVYYRVYIEGYYAGDGFVPYLHLPSGWSEHVFRLTIDLSRAGCGLAQALSSGSNVTVHVEGYAMVDLKAFGKLTWRTLTIPFNYTAANVQLPQLDPATRSLLALYIYACNNSSTLIQAIERLANLTSSLGGATPPTAPLPSPSPGGGANLSVTAAAVPVLGGFNVTVIIANNGTEPVTVYNVTAGDSTVEVDRTLEPGSFMIVNLTTTLPPVTATVRTSVGNVTAPVQVGLP
jgi:hypothetical protein